MPVVINGSTGITSPGGDTSAADNTINGLTVGKGGGNQATNTALGNLALLGTNSGTGYVTGLGYKASATNTTGYFNTAVGGQALQLNSTGNENTAVGLNALNQNTASNNTSVGSQSLAGNTSGAANTALGTQALYLNTTASNNTAVGYQSGYSNTTGASNTLLGQTAGYANSTGSGLVAVGFEALRNTTASDNTAVGVYAMKTNTTGQYNTALGGGQFGSNWGALGYNTTGSNNTAVGFMALLSNTTASNNTAVGYQALYSNTTGIQFAALGYQAGYSNTSAGSNGCYIGYKAGYSATGSCNTFVGAANQNGNGCGQLVTTGTRNTILGGYDGNQGGLDIRTSSNYIVLSDGDGNPRVMVNPNGYVKATNNASAGYITQTGSFHEFLSDIASATTSCIIGNVSASCTSDGILQARAVRNTTNNTFYAFSYYNSDAVAYKFRIADSGNATNTNGSYGTISDIKNKENIVDATPKLDKIKQLQVRNFNFKGDDLKQIGFIAQEFEQVFPSMIEEHKDTDAEGNDLGTTTKSIKTSVLVPILVKAVQELTAKVEALEAQLNK